MMKLWLTSWTLPNYSNLNGPVSSHTLFCRHYNRFLLHRPHLPRRQLWLASTQYPRKRSINIFYLYLHSHCTRSLLWLLPLYRNLKHRNHPLTSSYNNSIRRVCPPMRTNILLGRHSHHQSSLSRPLSRARPRPMNLRRVFCRQCHPNPIFCLSLFIPIYYRRRHSGSLLIPS